MGNELKLNSAEEAEVILIRLTPEEYPIAYANKVKCLVIIYHFTLFLSIIPI